MRLSLLKGRSTADAEISSISFDSKKIGEKCLFVCLKGTLNGHDFAYEAVKNGAVAIACAEELNIDIPQIIVADTRQTLAEASSILNGRPEKRLKLVGITGTNGKTTTSYILGSILNESGAKAGIIGTNGAVYCGKKVDLTLTTPDPPQLFSLLKDMADSGVTHVIMEVSAHALYLNKVYGMCFDVAAFTNLTQDHLDYFENMDDYGAAKAKLFTGEHCKMAVINADDPFGQKLLNSVNVSAISYGCKNPSDVFAIDLKMSVNGLEYLLNLLDDVAKIKFSMTGRFNMYNALCAQAIAAALGLSVKTIAEGTRKLKRVDGRYNIINTTRCSVIIDFAHTEDGLRNIISSIREFAEGRIITVFGCGGDRDRTKRPLMGKAAADLSDMCVLTSDNPRSEEPEAIIEEIAAGIVENGRDNFISVPDRRQAIKYALETAADGDIILLAGKGAEKYQEIKGVKYEYNDDDYILKLIEERQI